MKTSASHHSKAFAPRTFKLGLSIACAAALTAAPGSPLSPAVQAAPAPAAASPAAAADTSLDATDANALRGHLNEQVKIHGTPTVSGHSKSGNVAYLNFAGAHQGVALVFFIKADKTSAVASEDELKAYIGKKVVVTGKLEDYKGDLQIKIDTLDQIKTAP